ncbi:polyketide synthase PksN [Tumebacillus sp. BK434]|uniref:type I polyketide synthase n=1 Tax=Tumebacillus sp. BK434 TaxID=2512169 RepID=UPI00104BA255|nr:type I polyketide synthase [Tumebacillus sp. BK434]TCP55916.1 polyketide synthase PksN [Tumebacillus sp. BK434]
MTAQVKKYILSQVANQQLSKEEAKQLLLDLAAAEVVIEKDIAIVGMAGRFPKAADAEAFWQVLRSGENCIREFPAERVKDSAHVMSNPSFSEFILGNAIPPEDVGNIHAKAGYLDEIDKFDAAFFGIPPTEAAYMDPQHRMVLEVAWEAMEDAGYGGESLIGSKTGVYIGKDNTNYSYYRQSAEKHPMLLTGTWESLLASRISHLFDFKAPCMLIDTACSAGLISVHLAAQALTAGDCDVAIAGGVNLSINGEMKPKYLEGGANMGGVESGDSKIRTFDARADGTVWGEGVGLVVLKTLKQALADGDHIRAVIKGSAINNDGASSSITAPKAETQEAVIVDAWTKAGIAPETISYIEAHGTGTVLGDPIEIKGLSSAFRRYTSRKQFCAVGSLKTNTGHLVGASGVASLIKVIKSIEHKELAPTINFATPNPYINFPESPLYVNDALQAWETDGHPRRAALSSFGFSRTNCHMVLEEPPTADVLEAKQPRYCLTISAKNEQVMADYLRRYAQFVEEAAWNLADLCYTSNIGRGHYEHRTLIVAASKAELQSALSQLLANGGSAEGIAGVYSGFYRIVSEKKEQRDAGEISKHERANLSKTAQQKLQAYFGGESLDASLLAEFAALYVQGADVDWKLFYQGEARRRIPAPVYPLQRTRHWANPKISKVRTQQPSALHPLVDQQVTAPNGEIWYETTMRVEEKWVLKDHRIGGKAVLPGTTYLEMVRFAAARTLGTERLELRDVFFLAPLVVEDGADALVRLTLTQTAGGYAFAVNSQQSTGEWIPHVEGQVAALTESEPLVVTDLEALKQRADQVIDPYTENNSNEVFTFGPHWDTTRAVWQAGNETLARLQLHAELQHELGALPLHPSVLDNAVNLTSQSTGTFLPFMYKKLQLFGPMTSELYTHIRLQTEKSSGETLTYDVDLLDSKGNVLAQIRNYTTKRLHDYKSLGSGAAAGACLQLTWVPRADSIRSVADVTGPWALIATPGARAVELERAMAAAGADVAAYYLGEGGYAPDEDGFDAILASAEARGVKGILFASDYTMTDEERDQLLTSDHVFRARRQLGVDALFRFSRRLLKRKNKELNLLKVLTRDAWVVEGQESGMAPLSAATAALARVIGQEYRHLNVDILDVAGAVPVSGVVHECFQNDGWRALRPSGVYVEEMRAHREALTEELTLETDGVYVISGGLGGLGMAIAEFLAGKGPVNVLLLGRSEIAPTAEWAALAASDDAKSQERYGRLQALQSSLGALDYRALDVTDAAAVQAMHAALQARYGKINGIFHAAGVAGDGFLMLKEERQYHDVLNPKLEGSMNLLRLLPAGGDSFMVLFSSILAVTGGEGQGDYSAANAFLDSLSELGRQSGRNVSAMNWPEWEDLGMSAGLNQKRESTLLPVKDADVGSVVAALAFLDESPFAPISVADGMRWLEHSIVAPQRRVLPSSLNAALGQQLADSLPFQLAPELQRVLSAGQEAAAGGAGQSVQHMEVAIRGALHPTETQVMLGNAFGNLLGMSEIDIYTSFQDMGGNSLMTTQLLKLIDQHFPGMVDISDLFSYPSVKELADFIDERSGKSAAAAEAEPEEEADLMSLIEQELEGTEYLAEFKAQLNGRKDDGN